MPTNYWSYYSVAFLSRHFKMIYSCDINFTALCSLILTFFSKGCFSKALLVHNVLQLLSYFFAVSLFLISLLVSRCPWLFCMDLQDFLRRISCISQNYHFHFYGNNAFGLNPFITLEDSPAPPSATEGFGTFSAYEKTRTSDTWQAVSTQVVSSLCSYLSWLNSPWAQLFGSTSILLWLFLTYFQFWFWLLPQILPCVHTYPVPSSIRPQALWLALLQSSQLLSTLRLWAQPLLLHINSIRFLMRCYESSLLELIHHWQPPKALCL